MTKAAVAFIVTLAIAIVYGVIFKVVYPLVDIDAGLALGFALAGLLTYIIARTLLQRMHSPPKSDN
jgi:membrane protein implicated in regulation of membrane protease activity